MGLIDKKQVERKFTKALSKYDNNAIAQQQINLRLIELLKNNGKLNFSTVLEIGCGTGLFTQLLREHISSKNWIFNDICDVRANLEKLFLGDIFEFHLSDAEHWDFAKRSYDLITSASVIQWFNDPCFFIQRITRHLNSQGILLLSTFSQENLKEIRTLTGIGLDYPSLDDWQQWLDADYEIVYLAQQEICLSFLSPSDVLKHLKNTGVTGIKQHYWSKYNLRSFITDYEKMYKLENGKVGLTYSPILILAIKKEK